MTDCKHDIDSIYYVYDALKCKEQFLPLLANTLNYKYDHTVTTSHNRRIVDAFIAMEKYKGSEIGMKVATALCLISAKLSQKSLELTVDYLDDNSYAEALSKLNIRFDYENAIIRIDYPNIFIKATNLIDYVRPVGMCVIERSYEPMDLNSDVMLLYADASIEVHKYDPVTDSGINKTYVNFSTVGDSNLFSELNSMSDLDFNE